MITYLVKFSIYQYNSGRGDNGTYQFKSQYKTFEEARKQYDDLKVMLTSKVDDYEFISQYVWSGFLKSVDGIFRVTEEKIES